AQFPGWDNLYCRYAFSFGSDWSMVHGMDTGLSQLARKGNGSEQCVVWNFPIEISFKSTNAFGWPRIAISVSGRKPERPQSRSPAIFFDCLPLYFPLLVTQPLGEGIGFLLPQLTPDDVLLHIPRGFSCTCQSFLVRGADGGGLSPTRNSQPISSPSLFTVLFLPTCCRGHSTLHQVCALDSLGRDVVVGYGALLVPTAPGRYRRAVHLYAPLASSWMQRLWSWAAGSYPEFFDSKFVTRSEGREVTRVRRQGRVQVSLDVATRGMAAFGYDAGGWSGGAGASAIAQ
ncbi:unnamed protein product, partial [Phaeothamnion confervicola]